MCQNTTAVNMKELLLEYYSSDFALKDKSDRKTILQLWCETLDEQSPEVRDLIFYQLKLITERWRNYSPCKAELHILPFLVYSYL